MRSKFLHANDVRALGTLGDLPLVVLSHDPDKMRFPGNLTEPMNREWGKMQEELAHLSSTGSHIVVKGSGQDIQIDKPDAVVDAIQKVLGQAREAGKQSAPVAANSDRQAFSALFS